MLWNELRAPRAGSGGELSLHTQTYLDVHIALECLHMRYPVYIAETTSDERALYSYYLMLKNKKEEYAMEQSQQQAEMQRSMGRDTIRQ